MTALIEKIASTPFSQKLAHFLVPHKHNKHQPLLIRHESLFAITFIILLVQFFSFSGITSAHVLGYGTDINRATLITLTNQERSSRGIAALKENQLLDSSADLKGKDMFAKDYWAHFAPDGTSPWYFFKQVGYDYAWAGENLARDFSTSVGVIAGWMASQGHRDNMLNPNFTDIGISIQNGTLQGEQTTLVVEHLGQLVPSSTAAAPAAAGSSSGSSGTAKPAASPAKVQDTVGSSKLEAGPVNKPVNGTVNIPQVQEKIASVVSTKGFNLDVFWKSLGLGQKTTLLLLLTLMSLFAFDSFIIFKKGVNRHNSHSVLHAAVIAVLIVALVRSATGGIL